MPHRPGPWHSLHWGPNGDSIDIATPTFRGTLCRVYVEVHESGSVGPTQVDECEANARLIAAAPELLAALDGISPMFDNDSPLLTVYAAEIEQARAAIAKAEGKNT